MRCTPVSIILADSPRIILKTTIKKYSVLGSLCVLLSVVWGSAYAGSVTYAYDYQGRLIKATYSNGKVISYSYDVAGNRTSTVTSGA